MASKLVTGMGLDSSISNIFTARNILTAKDALCKTELELMELLDVPMAVVNTSIIHISEHACPPCHTVLSLIKEHAEELAFGHLPTRLDTLDDALYGGIPYGVVTEIVGPAGIGKTQFCLMLAVLAASQKIHGHLDGSVVYFDTEHKFNSGRMVEIARSRFPDIYDKDEMVRELAAHVLVFRSQSLSDFTESLQGLEEIIIEHGVKLIIADSFAALMQSENAWDDLSRKQDLLGHHVSILKSLAESFRIPIVVTNQVRTGVGSKESEATFSFEDERHNDTFSGEEEVELQLRPALGTYWAHSVNIRLILESSSGKRFIKIAKSPVSPVLAFPYCLASAGLVLIGTESVEKAPNEIMTVKSCGDGEMFLDDFEQMNC